MRLSYLVQRGNLYYFQCRVPSDLLQYFSGTQIRKTLKTSNRKQALTLVKGLTAKTERLFFMARTGILSPKMIQALVQEYMDNMLDSDKRDRYGIYETPLDAQVHQMQQDFNTRFLQDPQKNYLMLEEMTGEMIEVSGSDNLAHHYRCLASGSESRMRKQDHSEIAPIANALLQIEKIAVPENSPEFKMLCDSLLAKEAEAYNVMAERAEHGLNNDYDKANPDRAVYRRKKLSSLVRHFYKINNGQTNARSKKKTQEHFSKILELLANPYTDEINQDMLLDLFEQLSRYPKYRNHTHLQHLTLEECHNHPSYAPLDIETFKAAWYALGSVLAFGHENEEYGVRRNFCKDKIFLIKMRNLRKANEMDSDDEDDGRKPYSQENVQALIVQLNKRIRYQSNPHMLWIPLIALYNGMRQSEICQLYCDDVVVVDEIPCFRLRNCPDRLQSVKNPQSRRTIPIHPTLIKMGLLDFVESRRRQMFQRVWEGGKSRAVEYYAPQDNYSHYFEKWYNGTFRKYVITDSEESKQKPFHSLRHTFINWFFQNIRYQDRDNTAVKGLVGHLESQELKLITAALQGVTWDVYSQELNPARMLETLRLLDYGVDLQPLGLPITW